MAECGHPKCLAYQDQVRARIRDRGWTIMFRAAERDADAVAYTAGLTEAGLPELLVTWPATAGEPGGDAPDDTDVSRALGQILQDVAQQLVADRAMPPAGLIAIAECGAPGCDCDSCAQDRPWVLQLAPAAPELASAALVAHALYPGRARFVSVHTASQN